MTPAKEATGPVIAEGDELKGKNQVIINAEGRTNDVTVMVNGIKETFDTRKQVTVSDAQLVALQNSGHDVTEINPKTAKDSSGGEADGDEGSSSSAATADQSKKTVKVLKEEAEAAGITLDGKETKADLIAKINAKGSETAEAKTEEAKEAKPTDATEDKAEKVEEPDGNTTRLADVKNDAKKA